MELWQIGLIVLGVGGLAALVMASRADRRSAARVKAAIKNPPDREIPKFDPATPAPEYLAELEARTEPPAAPSTELTAADRAELRRALDSGSAVKMTDGYPYRDFATDSETGWAVLPNALILYAADEVTSMRELLAIIELVGASESLVVVAPKFADEVVDTLRVNKIQRKLRVVAVLSAADPAPMIAVTGGEPVPGRDLQAGYVPRATLGTAAQWVSSPDASWAIAH